MASQVSLTPQQQQAVRAFAAKYPGFDYRGIVGGGQGGNGAASYTKDPNGRQRFVDFMALKQQLAPALKHAHFTESGDVEKDMAWWKQALLAAGVVGAPVLAGALLSGVGAASAAGGVAAGSTVPAGVGIGETGATVGLGGSGFGAAAGTSAAATGAKGLWNKLSSPLGTTAINAGTNLIGTKMQVDANKQAAELQTKAAEEALAWQKSVYQQRREDLAPAIGVGSGASRALGDLLGIPAPEGGYHAPPPPGSAPATPAAAAPAPAATVQMRSPTGQVQAVPQAQVAHFQSLGATVVQ